jgi:hypothetical protein
VRWYYQAVPNDFKDWDMQLSPVAATVGGVPAVTGGGAIVYQRTLPATTNSPIAITSNAILVPAGAPGASAKGGVPSPQLVAYTVR